MAILALRRKKKDEAGERGPPAMPAVGVDEIPPFLAAKAVYRDRLRMMKAWVIGVTAVAFAIIALQEARFHGALGRYTNREILIVPGVVDFMRVRPNVLADNVVYYFAEYIAEQIGSFNHGNVEAKAGRVTEFFTPALRERYLADIRRNIRTWRELAVTEVFTPQPASKFVLERDGKGAPHYIVDVQGQLDRYSNDNKLVSSPEVITLKFRTSRVDAEKPWFFEVEEISRMSLDDWNRDRAARERMGRK